MSNEEHLDYLNSTNDIHRMYYLCRCTLDINRKFSDEISYLRKQIKKLKQKQKELAVPAPVHNPLNGGRRPMDERMKAKLARFRQLRAEGKKRKEIMAEMGISESTYQRYKTYTDTHQ